VVLISSSCRNVKVIVVIGGLVGAGKTSLAKELNRYYSRLNRRVCVLRLVAYPNVSYLFFDLLAKIFYGCKVVRYYRRAGVHPSTLVAKRIQKFSLLFAKIIFFVELSSLFLWDLYRRLRCFGSLMIIIDEGFVNAVANYLEILGKDATTVVSYVFKLAQKMNQKHRTVFLFVVADFDTLIKRWARRRCPIATSFIGLNHHIRYLKLMLFSLKLFLNSGFKIAVVDSSNKDVPILAYEAIKYVEDNVYR